MTREDIEQLNVVEPYCFESDKEELWYNVGLKNGLEIADENPKSPWISVEDDLPCNHKELTEGVNTKSVIICTAGATVYSNRMNYINGKWQWFGNGKVTHWMPIPEPPKKKNRRLNYGRNKKY